MLCSLDKNSALSNFSDSSVSCQLSGAMCHFFILLLFLTIKQKVKSVVKLPVEGW